MNCLIIDNYDSFSYNLLHLVGRVSGSTPTIVRNDSVTIGEIERMAPAAIILSPGPGHPGRPRDFGVCAEVLASLRIPLLGVCLGHQGIVHCVGGRVERAAEPMHGRRSRIWHTATGLFEGIPQGFQAVRYHSLVASELPDVLELTAWADGGIPMGVRHRELPFLGVQFHPESICTEHGERLIGSFLRVASGSAANMDVYCSARPSVVAPPPQTALSPRQTEVLHRRLDLPVDPEDVFVALYAREENAFWLDSSRAEPGLSRFSFMGAADERRGVVVDYRTSERKLRVRQGRCVVDRDGSIFDFLDGELRRLACNDPGLDFDFACGFVGYFGYELKAECGGRDVHRSESPDAAWLLADRVIAFDHQNRSVVLLALCTDGDRDSCDSWLDETEHALRAVTPAPAAEPEDGEPLSFRLRRDRDGYLADIRYCLDEIRSGESYEICLTNQIETGHISRPLELYRILRRVNPAPHGAYLRFGPTAILCSSPEQFLKIDRSRRVFSKPIKGTTARAADPLLDLEARRKLETSTKDRSENLMIVDLLRNDLGQVCEIGSIEVPRLMAVETYATVHQMVSTVRGRLLPTAGVIDCVRSAFPGGSMTGAPKIRTMEIIDRLERGPRGIYSGSIGYLSLNGAADLNIVIRTAVATPFKTTIGIGGAIVALSEPDAEFEEAILKARAVLAAFALAGERPRFPVPSMVTGAAAP
jgi:para-aminobenzoate synthetase